MAQLRRPGDPYGGSTEDYDLNTNVIQGPAYQPPPAAGGGAAPPTAPTNDLLSQAQALYGKNWDADAQQQFDYRMGQGQDANSILQHTGEDATARFNGTREQGAKQAPQGGGGGGNSGGGDGGGSSDIQAALKALWGGQQNQDIINSRVSNARDTLERQRKSTLANDRAVLANRGLLGSGPEATGLGLLDQNISDQFANAVTGIYADESQNADQRMMQALGLSTDLSKSDADRAIQQYLAETQRMGVGNDYNLGLGNLALGNSRNSNDYNLGLANFGLNRDQYLNEADNNDVEQLIQLIDALSRGAGQSAGGYT